MEMMCLDNLYTKAEARADRFIVPIICCDTVGEFTKNARLAARAIHN
jgi:hypothetical protein